MSEQSRSCGCKFCARLASKVMTTDTWLDTHTLHLRGAGDGFSEEPFNHPSGKMHWLVCPCGSKHLTDRER